MYLEFHLHILFFAWPFFAWTGFSIWIFINFTWLFTLTITSSRIPYITLFTRTSIIYFFTLTPTFTRITFLFSIASTFIQSTFKLVRSMLNYKSCFIHLDVKLTNSVTFIFFIYLEPKLKYMDHHRITTPSTFISTNSK